MSINERQGWGLAPIPAYNGGTLSGVYATGHGASMGDPEAGGRMHVVSNTSAAEFNGYLNTLEAAGYSRTAYNTIGSNIYAQYSNGQELVYIYYTDCENETRIIHDLEGTPENLFNYAYTAKPTDTTSFYQYALMFDPTGKGGYNVEKGKIYENCGLFDVIKLADNSVILIDGGWFPQSPDAAVEECFKFLCEITGTGENEKLRIAAFYFTHGHGDHIFLSLRLIEKYSDRIVAERLMHNLPVTHRDPIFKTFSDLLHEKYPDVMFAKLHTGQCIQLADAKLDVVFTHEDAVSPEGITEIREFNNTSVMIKLTVNGRAFMLSGDWGGSYIERDTTDYKPMERSLIKTFTLDDGTNFLKCDALQVAHHAINDWMNEFYETVDPDIAFIPQQDISFDKLAHGCYKNVITHLNDVLGVSNENIFLDGRYTYGITVSPDGEMTLSYRDIAGADGIYLEQIGQYTPFHEPKSGVVPFKD